VRAKPQPRTQPTLVRCEQGSLSQSSPTRWIQHVANMDPSAFVYYGGHKAPGFPLLVSPSFLLSLSCCHFCHSFFDNAMWFKGLFFLFQAALFVAPTNAAFRDQGMFHDAVQCLECTDKNNRWSGGQAEPPTACSFIWTSCSREAGSTTWI
jgi:hypothetical protein